MEGWIVLGPENTEIDSYEYVCKEIVHMFNNQAKNSNEINCPTFVDFFEGGGGDRQLLGLWKPLDIAKKSQ